MAKAQHTQYVIGIGASAGGLEALKQFFSSLPKKTGMSFIVIQHLSPNFKSLMDEILQKETGMKVVVPHELETEIEPDTVYLNSRDRNLIIKDKKISFEQLSPSQRFNLPIDLFMHSLGAEIKEKAMAIILSGTGSDGSRGIRTIKETGGLILVQSPSSAQFDGMPKAALQTGLQDFQGSPAELADTIIKLSEKDIEASEYFKDEGLYNQIIELIYNKSSVNFHLYKNTTLQRRIQKRMDLLHFTDLDEYNRFLEDNDQEQTILYNEFLIGVTHFFRDTELFNKLTSIVFPAIHISRSNVIRIWVCGCSTGEEAYSLAILLDKYLESSSLPANFKIFATDVDKKALNKAGQGLYPKLIQEDIPDDILLDYFTNEGEQYRIIGRIRDKIVFSQHNLLSDPPFINMDIISCRNLLIYFKQLTQDQALSLFQYALRKGGFLLLGKSESLGAYRGSFEVIDKKNRVFKNLKQSRIPRAGLFSNNSIPSQQRNPLEDINRSTTTQYREELKFYKKLTELAAPPTIILNREYNMVFSSGNLIPYMNLREGIFSNHIDNLFERNILSMIKVGLRKAEETHGQVDFTGVQSKEAGTIESYDIRIIPFKENTEPHYLIHFLQGRTPVSNQTTIPVDNMVEQQIQNLESEVAREREEKQQVIEELETSNEELQATNEELLSSNEELQSTNEELQSVNEELYTVNTELQERNDDLANLNNDMDNMLSSTQIGVLFLDSELLIRKFTPKLKELFNLKESDVGRSIKDFSLNFLNFSLNDFNRTIDQVIKGKTIPPKKIISRHQRTYLLNVLPFMNNDEQSGGVTITFVDITETELIRNKLENHDSLLEMAFSVGKLAWWDWRISDNTLHFDPQKARFIGYEPHELEKGFEGFTNLLHPEDYQSTMKAMKNVLDGNTENYNAEYRLKSKEGTYLWFQDRGQVVSRDTDGNPDRLLGVVNPIEKNTQAPLHLSSIEKDYRELFQKIRRGIVFQDPKGKIVFFNQAALDILGLEEKEMYNRNSNSRQWEAIREDGSPFPGEEHPAMKSLNTGKEVNDIVMGIYNPRRKERRWIHISACPIIDKETGKIEKVFSSFDDITEKKGVLDSHKKMLQERALLVRESHHRIKNNLSMVMSLLNLHKDELNEKGHQVIKEITQKIDTICQIHTLLYKSDENNDAIPIQQYISELIEGLINLDVTTSGVHVCTDIEPLKLPFEKALYCGLIVTELVQNSIKYGRNPGGDLQISVSFYADKEQYAMSFSDNGPGVSENSRAGLGSSLLDVFSTYLKGNSNEHSDHGYHWKIKFPKEAAEN